MANISVDTHQAWFTIETVHGHLLEYVLSAAASRQELHANYRYYTEKLDEMLRVALSKDTSWDIVESSVYGDVRYSVSAPTVAELQDALALCEQAVSAWAKLYNVNRMKERT